ncbi:VOC family protein [Lysinibacillus telephonicus]|uniref:VOC family protein n=1 Tax=Lysinibacillus telephonicus TaxID=1714840 RepID=A0A431UQQ1_9BACI|nr:VOC family protein [Lysinibacillus telephonicus]RTQ92503.1 VOC family protein [Lysinibacillus telephonicus]
MKLTHVRLLTKNFKACFLFYRNILGFEVGWGNEESRYAEFKAGETIIGLFDRKAMAKAIGTEELLLNSNSMDKTSLIILVDSVEDTYHSLKKQGVKFINEPHNQVDWGIRVAHFRDPDDNLIEIYEAIESD